MFGILDAWIPTFYNSFALGLFNMPKVKKGRWLKQYDWERVLIFCYSCFKIEEKGINRILALRFIKIKGCEVPTKAADIVLDGIVVVLLFQFIMFGILDPWIPTFCNLFALGLFNMPKVKKDVDWGSMTENKSWYFITLVSKLKKKE